MTRDEAKALLGRTALLMFEHNGSSTLDGDKTLHIIDKIFDEHEALQQPKRCDGCWYVKITINSVICGKNGTFKEADDYCKYYNPKEQ